MPVRHDRPNKWLDLSTMKEIYEFMGTLLLKEVDMLEVMSETERNRWLQTIYGKYAARYARWEYERIIHERKNKSASTGE